MADTTLQQDLEAAVVLAETDASLLHDVIHGGATTDVVTDGGSVKSLAKVMAGLDDVTRIIAQTIGWGFSNTTAMANPGAGLLRFDNATLSAVTAIALADADSHAADVSAYVNSWAASTDDNKGTLTIVKAGALATFAQFTVTGLTDNAGWTELAVSFVNSAGAFADADDLFIHFARTGDKGTEAVATDQVTWAGEWANKDEDALVSAAAGGDEIDDYSALHYAKKCEALEVVTSAYATAAIAAAAGVKWRGPALVATTANITLSGEKVIDGEMTSASRVLVKNQTTPAENGVYDSGAGAWTRATDANTWDALPSLALAIQQGAMHGDTLWICSSDVGGTLDTTDIVFVQFGAGGIGAASVDVLTNKTIDANGTGNVLTNIDIDNVIAADQLEAEAGTDNTKLVTPLRVAQAIAALAVTAVVGEMRMFSGTSAPSGWLFCDGGAIDRTTYADLFVVLDTTFGPGDGSTTFNIPDMQGRTPIGVGSGASLTVRALGDSDGEETHVLSVAEMPAHGHSYTAPGASTNVANASEKSVISGGSGSGTGSAGSNGPHNNMQPYLAVNFIVFAGVF